MIDHVGDVDLTMLDCNDQRRDLRAFVRAGWSSHEPGTRIKWGWHIDAICEHLQALAERRIRRLVINQPPRTLKTTLASIFFPAWCWVAGDPSMKIITCSYAEKLTTDACGKTRRLFDTPWYQALNRRPDGSPIFSITGRDLLDSHANDRGGIRLCAGVNSALTGFGGHLVAVDDPHNVKQADSDAERQQALEWWDRTAASRLDDPQTGLKLIVMQRLNMADLTGHVLARDHDYVHLCLPMEFDPRSRCTTVLGLGDDGTEHRWSDPRTQDGELLCPEHVGPTEVAELKRTQGPWVYAGQYQQAPAPEGGGIFKRAWFDGEGRRYRSHPTLDGITISLDTALTSKDSTGDGSYTVAMVFGAAGCDDYLLDLHRGHLDFVSTRQLVRDLAARWKPNRILIEQTVTGVAVINELGQSIPGIVPIKPQGSKEARASAVSGYIEAGNLKLPENAPWLADLLSELTTFPRAGHDDQVDCLTQYLAHRHVSTDGAARSDKLGTALDKWRMWGGRATRNPAMGTPEDDARYEEKRRRGLVP